MGINVTTGGGYVDTRDTTRVASQNPTTSPQPQAKETPKPAAQQTTIAPIDWQLKPNQEYKSFEMGPTFRMPERDFPTPAGRDPSFEINGDKYKEAPLKERAMDWAKENIPTPVLGLGAAAAIAAGGKVKFKIDF